MQSVEITAMMLIIGGGASKMTYPSDQQINGASERGITPSDDTTCRGAAGQRAMQQALMACICAIIRCSSPQRREFIRQALSPTSLKGPCTVLYCHRIALSSI
eukprot:scaffold48523_cov19-Prasinocladus_malaysianus.AAC.1